MSRRRSQMTRGGTGWQVRESIYLTNPAAQGGEIGRMHESCISNPKSQISNWTRYSHACLRQSNLRFRISDLRCRIRPISKFPLSGWPDYSSMLLSFPRSGIPAQRSLLRRLVLEVQLPAVGKDHLCPRISGSYVCDGLAVFRGTQNDSDFVVGFEGASSPAGSGEDT